MYDADDALHQYEKIEIMLTVVAATDQDDCASLLPTS